MREKYFLMAATFILVGCSTSSFICNEGFEKNEEQDNMVRISCVTPEFEICCNPKTYEHVGDHYSCDSFKGDKYSVTDMSESPEVSDESVPPKKSVEKVEDNQEEPEKRTCEIEDWDCEPWGACNGGKESRNCVSEDDCNVEDIRPETNRSCEESRICSESDWECTEWTYCMNNKRSRECELSSTDCRKVKEIDVEEQCSDVEARLDEISRDIEKRTIWINEWDEIAKELSSKSANEIYLVTNQYRKDLAELTGIYNEVVDGKSSLALVIYRVDNFKLEMDSIWKKV